MIRGVDSPRTEIAWQRFDNLADDFVHFKNSALEQAHVTIKLSAISWWRRTNSLADFSRNPVWSAFTWDAILNNVSVTPLKAEVTTTTLFHFCFSALIIENNLAHGFGCTHRGTTKFYDQNIHFLFEVV